MRFQHQRLLCQKADDGAEHLEVEQEGEDEDDDVDDDGNVQMQRKSLTAPHLGTSVCLLLVVGGEASPLLVTPHLHWLGPIPAEIKQVTNILTCPNSHALLCIFNSLEVHCI